MGTITVLGDALPDADGEMARLICADLRSLLIEVVGDAYALRAALPAGAHRRDAQVLEETAQRAALQVEQLATILGVERFEDPGSSPPD